MFAYNDPARYAYEHPKNKYYRFPYFDTGIFFKDKYTPYEYAYVYESDLENYEENNRLNNKIPIAIFAENKIGDGSFPIYKGKNAFWIMSGNIMSKMLHLIDVPY
jgi:hypothetical protein